MLPTFKKMGNNWVVDPLNRYVKGGLLVPTAANTPIVIAAGGRSPAIMIEAPQDAAAEVLYLQGSHAEAVPADTQQRMTVEIYDQSFRRLCQNRAVLVDHVFGTGQTPFYLKESVFLQPQQGLQFSFFNPAAAGETNFRFAASARKVQQAEFSRGYMDQFVADNWDRKTLLQPFWFTTNEAVTIPAGGNATAFLTNTQDKFCAFFYAMARAITTGVAGDTQERVSFQFFDPKTERPMQNTPVTLNCGTGNANFPYILPSPILMEPNVQMRVQMTNLITDQPTEVFLTFHGVACYTGEGLWAFGPQTRPPLNMQPAGGPR